MGVKDVTVVSEKAKLSHNSYRIDKDGNVDVPQVTNFTDSIEEDLDEEKNTGLDYSEYLLQMGPPVFLDKNGIGVTVLDVNGKCCRASRNKCKTITYENGRATECKVQLVKYFVKSKKKNQRKDFTLAHNLKNMQEKMQINKQKMRKKR